jgi:MFS family permease
MAGPYLGAGLAFLAGGFVVSHLEAIGHVDWPIIGTRAPWQAAFIFVGLPGFLFALLMLTVREPVRQERLAGAQSMGAAFSYILKRWRGFGAVFVGSTCNFAMSAMTFWTIPLFQRVYGWGIAETGAITGLFYFTAGPLGTALAVWAQRRFQTNHSDATMRLLLLGLFIVIPTSALYPVMPTAELAVGLMFIAFIGKSVATAGGPSSMMQITPGEIRSQSMAIFNTVIALIGPLFGPPLIGWAIDATGDPKSIGMVLSGYVLILGIPAIVLVWLGLRHFRSAVHDLEQALKA